MAEFRRRVHRGSKDRAVVIDATRLFEASIGKDRLSNMDQFPLTRDEVWSIINSNKLFDEAEGKPPSKVDFKNCKLSQDAKDYLKEMSREGAVVKPPSHQP